LCWLKGRTLHYNSDYDEEIMTFVKSISQKHWKQKYSEMNPEVVMNEVVIIKKLLNMQEFH